MANISKVIKPKFVLHDLYNNIEHDLFENIVVEYCDIAGIVFDYYIRNEDRIESDTLYGEPKYQNILYNAPRRSKFLYEPTDEPALYDPFGVHSEEMIQYAYMPKFTFSRDISAGYHPKPGDGIITIWNDRAYEVVDAYEEIQIFQVQKSMWQFILKPYRFSEQSASARAISRFNYAPSEDLADTLTTPLTAYGDNKEIEEESDSIDAYGDVDTSIYGF